MGVGLDATPAGKAIADDDYCAPLGKTRAHLKILLEPVAQSVQTFGDLLSRKTSQVLRASIHFDAGNDPRLGENFDKRRAVFLLLADRLVEKNCSAYAFAKAGRGHNQFPIGTPGFHGLRNTQLRESFVAGGMTFVHRQQALIIGHHCFRGVCQNLRIHND